MEKESPCIGQEKLIRASLRTIKGIGSQHLRQLIAYFGSAAQAWEAPQSDYPIGLQQEKWISEILKARKGIDPQKIGDALTKQGIRLITPHEKEYPGLLAELTDAPPLLYYRGQLKGNTEVVAFVGARKATAYGKSAARVLAKDAAAKGIVIASGLARGIDTSAHQGALDAEGITWAFMGCGLDQVYPRENQRLADNIVNRGALISEFTPGTPPNATNFPARNRLISGCSLGVVVVEAAEKSGALITVDFALEQGREVFAVPGPIFSSFSRGTHQLIRQGAKIVETIGDIFNELPTILEMRSGSSTRENRVSKKACDGQNKAQEGQKESESHALILQQLCDVPLHIDQLVINSTLAVSEISLALLELQLGGKIIQLPGQHYVLARSS